MKVAVVGSGYVGLVAGACFAELGNAVICVDNNQKKIEDLKKGIVPIYEPGLESLIIDNQKKGSLKFTSSLEDAVQKSDIVFIAVGTPQGEDGSADLQYVLAVAESIGQVMKHPLIIVDKSTVPVGTAEKVRKTVELAQEKRNVKIPFSVASNPEFLKEGAAIKDFMHPDRVVIGADNPDTIETMKSLYQPFTTNHERFIAMDIRSAEMTKYAANAMLATKISFMNEMANICEKVGADINAVRVGIGSDLRIGYHFIYPGCGYGGSCFPKDVQALVKTAKDYNYTPRILEAVEAVNFDQKKVLINKVIAKFGEDLKGFTFAVWGLSFKPDTDDMREASSVVTIRELTLRGAKIQAYDPKARHEAESYYLKGNRSVSYSDNKYDALKNANALILITEWKEFRSPDFEEIVKLLKSPIIFDGRNQYKKDNLKKLGIEYFQIGVSAGN